jgi:hypothetical protein
LNDRAIKRFIENTDKIRFPGISLSKCHHALWTSGSAIGDQFSLTGPGGILFQLSQPHNYVLCFGFAITLIIIPSGY